MNFPTYTLETPDGVMTYGYNRNYRKWGFRLGKFVQIIPCHGNEQGHKIANIIVGSIKRCGKMVDGLARANIDSVIRSQSPNCKNS